VLKSSSIRSARFLYTKKLISNFVNQV
jgi:hypothetical protein